MNIKRCFIVLPQHDVVRIFSKVKQSYFFLKYSLVASLGFSNVLDYQVDEGQTVTLNVQLTGPLNTQVSAT